MPDQSDIAGLREELSVLTAQVDVVTDHMRNVWSSIDELREDVDHRLSNIDYRLSGDGTIDDLKAALKQTLFQVIDELRDDIEQLVQERLLDRERTQAPTPFGLTSLPTEQAKPAVFTTVSGHLETAALTTPEPSSEVRTPPAAPTRTRQGSLFDEASDDVVGDPPQTASNPVTEDVAAELGNSTSPDSGFIRPDRQRAFPGLLPHQWPEPENDHDTIAVDRIGVQTDGGPHRFTIRRGDTVKVYFRYDRWEQGTVVGISHARLEARVRFRDDADGQWFSIGKLYPTPQTESAASDVVPLSAAVDGANNAPPDRFSETDRVPVATSEAATAVSDERPDNGVDTCEQDQRPFTLEDFQAFRHRLDAGEITAEEFRGAFHRFRAAELPIIEHLITTHSADELKTKALRLGHFDANRNSKAANGSAIYRTLLQSFTLSDSLTYQPLHETLEEAVARVVDGIGDQDVANYTASQRHAQADREKALSNPESLADFDCFCREMGEERLSLEQLARYDQLRADLSRERRRQQKTPATVRQVDVDENLDLEMTIIEGYHEKKECPVWIAKLNQRVDRETYKTLLGRARQLNGWYSNFKKDQAGFQFWSQESADKFRSLLDRDADRDEELAVRKARKLDSASERLQELADNLDAEATAILEADEDKLRNTVRRAEMAAGMRGRAYAQQAFAGTLRSLSAALAAGEATYLDGVRSKTQVHALVDVLARAKTRRNDDLMKQKSDVGVWERHYASEQLRNRPPGLEDIPHAIYPHPTAHRSNLADAVTAASTRKGAKQRANGMRKWLKLTSSDIIEFREDYEIEALMDFIESCTAAGVNVRWIEWSGLEDYKRLHAANIHTLPELRCALRELVPLLQKKKDDDPVAKAEQALIGKKIDSFFPTPRPIISRMLELAEIQPGDRVLEPSAGKGDILDMLKERYPDAIVTAIEINGTLFDVLEAKRHDVQHGDFLEHSGSYERVVMNPPFEHGADQEHVRHAFDQLAPDGKLVAIMSEGAFFRSDTKAVEFRQWLEDVVGTSEELPDDAFKGADAFRQTGVKTRLVTIEKPAATSVSSPNA